MIKRKITLDERRRRKRERMIFIKQRLSLFTFISRLKVRIPMDWRKYLHLPEIQSILMDARQILFYSPSTPDYTIWLTLYRNFYKKYNNQIA